MPSSSKKQRGRQRKANKTEAAARIQETHPPPPPPPQEAMQTEANLIARCSHSRHSNVPGIVIDACKSFNNGTSVQAGLVDLNEVFQTHVLDKFPQIIKKPWHLRVLKEIMVGVGTTHLLENKVGSAKLFACACIWLEHYLEVPERSGKKIVQFRLRELAGDGERTVTRFFVNRTPCDCLKKKYKETKTHTKMGCCFNCLKQREFLDLEECARCGIAHYCGKECQKSHWQNHKQFCDDYKIQKKVGLAAKL